MKNSTFNQLLHRSIPGGSHTYSKGDDQFPDNAPRGIKKGKGAWVWDIEDNKYLDCSMGLGSVTLGHAFKPIVNKVVEEMERGINFQRPSYIELEAAEKFLSLFDEDYMIKFSKNGSNSTTAAIKLARAYTGKNKIAFPEDHPFFSFDDWFIISKECNKGIPKVYDSLSIKFKSCDINSFKELILKEKDQLACIIMEPQKFSCGNCNCFLSPYEYMKEVIKICNENNIVFILDEMVSGFKIELPGAVKKYDLKPDLITYGKGIANGFSCSALVGKRKIMNLGSILTIGAEKVFLTSTTHGGETHSLRALISTIDFYTENNVVERINEKGNRIINFSRTLIAKYNLQKLITVSNTTWTPIWFFNNYKSHHSLKLKTIFLKEMIANKILFQGAIVPSFSHGDLEIEYFLNGFEKSLHAFSEMVKRDHFEIDENEVIKPVFRKHV